MKKDIHPQYNDLTVTCGCGNEFTTRSTSAKIAVEVCSNCHPFYTGKQKLLDSAGRVERFNKRWQGDAAKKAQAIKEKKAEALKPRAPVIPKHAMTRLDQLPGGSPKPKPAGATKTAEAPKPQAAPVSVPAPQTPPPAAPTQNT